MNSPKLSALPTFPKSVWFSAVQWFQGREWRGYKIKKKETKIFYSKRYIKSAMNCLSISLNHLPKNPASPSWRSCVECPFSPSSSRWGGARCWLWIVHSVSHLKSALPSSSKSSPLENARPRPPPHRLPLLRISSSSMALTLVFPKVLKCTLHTRRIHHKQDKSTLPSSPILPPMIIHPICSRNTACIPPHCIRYSQDVLSGSSSMKSDTHGSRCILPWVASFSLAAVGSLCRQHPV